MRLGGGDMAEKRPLVFNVQKFSVHDGPGIRTTIFFKGCPLACPWCHNPESQRFEVERMERSDGGQDEVGTYYSVAELVRQAVQDQIFYERSGGGVTLSGGEVLAQPMGYIADLVRALAEKGISVGIDTSGAVPFTAFEPVLTYTDFFLYDMKLFDAERHRQYMGQGKYVVDVKVVGNNLIERFYMQYMPVPLLSVITDDCIANGKDYNAGGARYNTSYIQCVGIATITDSLAVLKQQVFEQRRFTMEGIITACDRDFDGDDALLDVVLHHTPKYGNDDDYADAILHDVDRALQATIAGRPTPKGSKTVVEFLPTTCHVYFGQVMGASPNGRRAHVPLPDGISPEKGADTHGPTAVIKSCAKLEQLKTGGALLNQKFTPSVVAGPKGLACLAALVRSYFTMDGHHIQFNVVDRETLLDAQRHPEQYENLIVRVAGYSDYFNNLDKALQDEIINRTEQSFGA